MSVYEVPQREWKTFLRRFADDHRGELISVEITGRPEGEEPSYQDERGVPTSTVHQRLARDLPLAALSFSDNPPAGVHVNLGEPPAPPRTITLSRPQSIRLEQPGASAVGTLRVRSDSEGELVLRFSGPLVPGELNGIA